MTSKIEANLATLGLALPEKNAPAANYIAYQRAGNIIYVSGQICKWNGELLYKGAVEKDVSLDDAVKAAEICALNMLLQLKAACNGNLDNLKSCLKLSVYIKSDADFKSHATVANGASDIFIKTMGDKGQHTRISMGCISLPADATVEICGVFEVENI
ncbi:MAG: RidA family protein [Emcibacter sp.]|nr:RidA family protein [Emcibacter sp.]